MQKDDPKRKNLTIIEGNIEQVDKIKETIHGATYVVSMLGKTSTISKDGGYTNKTMLLDYMKILYPLMIESSTVKVLLYQAGAFNQSPTQAYADLPWAQRRTRTW